MTEADARKLAAALLDAGAPNLRSRTSATRSEKCSPPVATSATVVFVLRDRRTLLEAYRDERARRAAPRPKPTGEEP